MSETSDKLRILIAASPLDDGRAILLRQIRLIARKRVYAYALEHHITDFNDTQLVSQRHRNYRQTQIDTAMTFVAPTQAATDVPGLLVVFDSISGLI